MGSRNRQVGQPAPPLFIRHCVASYVAGVIPFVAMFPFAHPFEEKSWPLAKGLLIMFALMPLSMPFVLVVGIMYAVGTGSVPKWPLWVFYGLYFLVLFGMREYFRRKPADPAQ